MALKKIDQNPSLSDTVLFDLYTTDSDGEATDPYKVNVATIFFVERDYVNKNLQSYSSDIQGFVSTFYYKDAIPFKVFGTEDFPAWLSTDTENALVTLVETGHFQLQWTPELAKEGDYFLCYTWTPIEAGDSYSTVVHFYLVGDRQPAVIPSHKTDPLKYPTLLERYTPEFLKQYLLSLDISPEVIQKTNAAIADGFTDIENLYNQLIDLLDANVVKETFLPYLANFFRMKLRSQDPILWRRQVRRAVPLLKKKGTLGGLQEALEQAGIEFKKITYYWQVVSKTTWQEAFLVDTETVFQLSKKAILPATDENFEIYYRPADGDYELLSLDYVSFATTPGTDVPCTDNTPDITYATWTGESVYSNPISLSAGDTVRIVYKVSESPDQDAEDYIRTLPLADNRDQVDKNWNVRLIADDDFLFDVICPFKHDFQYPLVYGKIRTEFPYSENIYNMEEYSGSTRNSTNPCDLDGDFRDVCSCCRSSKISVDVEIDGMSDDRISETEEIIKEFVPFHAVIHSVNYVGSHDDLILPPVEEVECLIQFRFTENLFFGQYDFNRIVYDGLDDTDTAKRNMLASSEEVATGSDGIGYNLAYYLYSPGVNFSKVGIREGLNLLEVLSGDNAGEYELENSGDVLGLSNYPLDEAGFPYRFSNIQYEEMAASVYQDNLNVFSDDVDFSIIDIPNTGTWSIEVKTGPQAGTYPIERITSHNTLILSNWSGSDLSDLDYDLVAPGSIVAYSSITGEVTVESRGRLETSLSGEDVDHGDYVLFAGDQYKVLFIDGTDLYIDEYEDGDQVGSVDFTVLRRLVEGEIGYFNFRGMRLRTTLNYETSLGIQNGQTPSANPTESSDFKENYLVLIDDTYYTMSDIDGQDIYLVGPVENWGLAGETTGVSYSIIHIANEENVTIQNGKTGEFNTFIPYVNRSGDSAIFILQQDAPAPMALRMQMLNDGIEEAVSTKEELSYTIERR